MKFSQNHLRTDDELQTDFLKRHFFLDIFPIYSYNLFVIRAQSIFNAGLIAATFELRLFVLVLADPVDKADFVLKS